MFFARSIIGAMANLWVRLDGISAGHFSKRSPPRLAAPGQDVLPHA